MKTLMFTLAVTGAAIYLGYSQSDDLRRWADQSVTPHIQAVTKHLDVAAAINRAAEHSPGVTATLHQRIATLEQEVARLNRELAEALTAELDSSRDAPAQISESEFADLQDADLRYEATPHEPVAQTTGTLSNRDRSAALLVLAERMELKAIGH